MVLFLFFVGVGERKIVQEPKRRAWIQSMMGLSACQWRPLREKGLLKRSSSAQRSNVEHVCIVAPEQRKADPLMSVSVVAHPRRRQGTLKLGLVFSCHIPTYGTSSYLVGLLTRINPEGTRPTGEVESGICMYECTRRTTTMMTTTEAHP